ncbi:type II 3-dehydroquinate dehydratase [Hoeflea sp. TYP-13]|uniref:type II 3-dehydroquinate dehydratase n=1 Tax=Hoeflea sp. TYP-13 TaxID=3230023 RepID=UPI0034C6A71F
MARKVFVLNGPNLNSLGKREPGIYGGKTLSDIETDCRTLGNELGFEIDFRQTNHEGVLVDWLQEAGDKAVGVAINPGAYSHTSIALHDAIRSIDIPVVELHLSNIHAREAFRHVSMVSPVVAGVILGFGPNSYDLALRALADICEN